MEHTLFPRMAPQLLDHAPFGMVVLDQKGNISWLNGTLKDLLGADGDNEAAVTQRLKSLLAAQGGFPVVDPRDGSEIWLRHTARELQDPERGPLTAHFFEDITETKALQLERDQLSEELRKRLSHDPQTGLLSQHAVLQSLQPLVSLSRRYGKPLSVVFMSLTNLGQSEVDSKDIVTAVGHFLKDQIRWADLIGRYGPDQFLLVLPETTKDDASRLVEKIAPKIARLDAAELPVRPIELTVHFGISEWIKGDDAGRLVRRAIEAMNLARESGERYAASL